jgi:opacity protein-like surface antigen
MKNFKRQLFVVLLITNLSISINAQDLRPQIRLRAGQSNSIEDFESKNVNQFRAGFAEDGFVVGVGIQQPIIPMLDATSELSFSSYAMDASPVLRQIETQAPTYNWTLDDGNYEVKNFTIGLRLYGGNKFKFYVNPVIGFSWISFPTIALEGYTIVQGETRTAYSRQYTDNSRTFMFGISGGLEYLVSDNFGLNLQVEQIKYDFETDAELQVRDINQMEGSLREEAKGNYSVLNLTVGLVFKFDWKEEE